MLTPRTIASQMRISVLVLTIQKNGNEHQREQRPAEVQRPPADPVRQRPVQGDGDESDQGGDDHAQSMVLLASFRCSFP